MTQVATVRIGDDAGTQLVVFVHVEGQGDVAARLAALELTAGMGVDPTSLVDAPVTYHNCLLAAVEAESGVTDDAALRQLRASWRRHLVNAATHNRKRG